MNPPDLNCRVIFRVHAFKRMKQRDITVEAVYNVLEHHVVIENYPNRRPLPRRLLYGRHKLQVLHVVVEDDWAGNAMYVRSVYEPDPKLWKHGLRKRKRKPR